MKTRVFAYSYIRFSHPDQAKGDSLRRQTELRDAWLARNKVALDASLTLEDKGVSGYTGEHRDNPDRHALAAFVALVEKGRVARGSYLIVENLDRLSREDIVPALSLLLNLIQNGIRVVQLLPVETVFDVKTNPMSLMMAIMELSRGHSESAMKSERNGRAWQAKRRRAAANGEPLTARTPAWLQLVGGEWKVNETAAQTIRRIYQMATEGYGLTLITKRLNAEHVPLVGRGQHWAKSYVGKLLGNRAIMGEYQPFTGRGTRRKPEGDPVPDYYPAVITEKEWYTARAALAARRSRPGRLGRDHLNLFTGLLYDARDGGAIHVQNKGKKRESRILVGYRAIHGLSKFVSFPFLVFERAILSQLKEIDPAAVLPRKDKGADKSLALTGRLVELEGEIEKIKTRLQEKYSDALADVLDRHEAEKKAVNDELTQARQEEASPLSEAWGECGSLLDALDAAPDAEEARMRLRAALRRIVTGVWCLFVGRGRIRLAAVQIWFTGGARRDYLILSRPATGGAAGHKESSWWACSLAEATGPDDLDLRERKDVLDLERALNQIDLENRRLE
jgi:DNA invertase Pin-like site-specific DNA recombinase